MIYFQEFYLFIVIENKNHLCIPKTFFFKVSNIITISQFILIDASLRNEDI